MKKSLTILTAFLAVSLLAACGGGSSSSSSSSSSSTEPTPVTDWTAEEKAIMKAGLGGNILPYYYVKDQVVTDAYAEEGYPVCISAGLGTEKDLKNYEVKFASAGYDVLTSVGTDPDDPYYGEYELKCADGYTVYVETYVGGGKVSAGEYNVDCQYVAPYEDQSKYGLASYDAAYTLLDDYFALTSEYAPDIPETFKSASTNVDFIDGRYTHIQEIGVDPEAGIAKIMLHDVTESESTAYINDLEDKGFELRTVEGESLYYNGYSLVAVMYNSTNNSLIIAAYNDILDESAELTDYASMKAKWDNYYYLINRKIPDIPETFISSATSFVFIDERAIYIEKQELDTGAYALVVMNGATQSDETNFAQELVTLGYDVRTDKEGRTFYYDGYYIFYVNYHPAEDETPECVVIQAWYELLNESVSNIKTYNDLITNVNSYYEFLLGYLPNLPEFSPSSSVSTFDMIDMRPFYYILYGEPIPFLNLCMYGAIDVDADNYKTELVNAGWWSLKDKEGNTYFYNGFFRVYVNYYPGTQPISGFVTIAVHPSVDDLSKESLASYTEAATYANKLSTFFGLSPAELPKTIGVEEKVSCANVYDLRYYLNKFGSYSIQLESVDPAGFTNEDLKTVINSFVDYGWLEKSPGVCSCGNYVASFDMYEGTIIIEIVFTAN